MGDSTPEVQKEEAPEPALCGHVNLHSLDANGKPDNLACTREAGHTGNHSAPHFERGKFNAMAAQDTQAEHEEVVIGHKIVPDQHGNEVAVEVLGYEGEFIRHWGDAAGIPAKDIKPEKADAPFGGAMTTEKELEAKLAN